MSISSIKPTLLLPQRELIIGKNFVLQGKPALLASLTEQDGIIKLWLFQQIPIIPSIDIEYEATTTPVTNRADIQRRTAQPRVGFSHFSEIIIQGINLPISQSSTAGIGYDPVSYMKLQHFIEAGIDFSWIENVSFQELALCEYQLADGFAFPNMNKNAEMTLSLYTNEESVEVIVEPTYLFHLDIGEQTDIQRSFTDDVEGKEIVYHIDRVVLYDIWEETEKRFNDETTIKAWREHGLDDAAIKRMKAEMPESIGRICPKGHKLLILQYECPEKIQLNFYTTEFLNSVPEHTGSGTIGIIGSSDESVHGYPVRTCILKTVPADFTGTVDVEFISWHRRIPGERIEA